MSTYNDELREIIRTKAGLELYESLYVLHVNAKNNGIPITYPEVDPRTDSGHENKVLEITVYGDLPSSDPNHVYNWKRKSIPLSYYTDFNNWTFKVSTSGLNEDRNLFYLAQDSTAIHPLEEDNAVSRESIENGHFHDHPILKTGKNLLLIEDNTPWTYRNETPDTYHQPPTPWANWDHEHPFARRDVLLIKDGFALNRPISSYSTMQSDPVCNYVTVPYLHHVFKNVTMIRTTNCAVVINLVHVKLLDDVTIENVEVVTPSNTSLTRDRCINIEDATNITIDNFSMNQTYCNENGGVDDYGYGIQMFNVWNSIFRNLRSNESVWGFFGCRYVNTSLLEHCEINRFDIHCYGRDITCRNCTFAPNPTTYSTTYQATNRFASLCGNLIYEDCTFDNFVPYKTDYAYNIFQAFDILFRRCTFNVVRSDLAQLIEMGFWGAPLNARQELVRKCAPNVTIDDVTIVLGNNISEVNLFFYKDRQSFTEPVYHISYISINNLKLRNASGSTLPSTCFKETNLTVNYAERVFRFRNLLEVSSF